MLKCEQKRPHYVELAFSNGVGGELFVASGCDADEKIDQLVSLDPPEVKEGKSATQVIFRGKTTLWEKAEYTFSCEPARVLYGYKVFGKGAVDNARYFEGFLADDPRMKERFYPYFAGWGRHVRAPSALEVLRPQLDAEVRRGALLLDQFVGHPAGDVLREHRGAGVRQPREPWRGLVSHAAAVPVPTRQEAGRDVGGPEAD